MGKIIHFEGNSVTIQVFENTYLSYFVKNILHYIKFLVIKLNSWFNHLTIGQTRFKYFSIELGPGKMNLKFIEKVFTLSAHNFNF